MSDSQVLVEESGVLYECEEWKVWGREMCNVRENKNWSWTNPQVILVTSMQFWTNDD